MTPAKGTITTGETIAVKATDEREYTIKITEEEKVQNLLNKIVSDNIKVNKFEIMKPTLNDIFIEKVEG